MLRGKEMHNESTWDRKLIQFYNHCCPFTSVNVARRLPLLVVSWMARQRRAERPRLDA